ncbi:MAG: type II toxin-antitoxin system VapC family toxin [Gammaproteobacteria bacterium]|nr:type II toxin-antitoxin system VapC family toxin [Gammaproteobacteria bacterium]
MPRPVLLDTDVLVDFLRGHAGAVACVEEHAERVILSAVTVAELYAGVRGGEEEPEQTALTNLLSQFRIVDVSGAVARLGGLYKRDYGPKHGLGLADAVIAATATLEGASLKTLNTRHYPMFDGLARAYRK